ncbi:fungal-specific transcription factor domain-containing protein [Podospora appendiculata]|uniref:Fungal-specific transcription factor domain-containing protein n=1 Tax=Podospora appendiculata TaxID=314037 RepID=A0AAE0XF80_9PEZI|nr:fungal-specific transcription factor domain-containing protein [Podospora appendiculata]
MSDEESEDLSQHEPASPSEAAVKSESEGPPETSGSAGETATMPVQKRRRVTRACDECRRKKIKCDGKQPCSHCSIYSYECTYDKPSNRRRNPAPQYIEALETRLQRAEALLRKFMPDVDLSDPDLDPTVQQEFRTREQARAQAMLRKTEASEDHENQDAHIMSMIETYGQLDLNEGGEWDFHGISSGAVFLRRMKEHFQGLLGNEYRIPFLPRPSRPAGMFSLDSPRSNASSPWDVSAVPNIFDLPPRDKARTLCYYALNCATCLLRVVHGPSFYEMLDRLYETPQDSWGSEENRFLGLLYSVLALGSMYNITEDSPASPPVTYKSSMEEGTKYYASARLILQDVAECRDIISLQGLVYMILFLQSTSNISGCYAFLGIALRSSLRMGLHRNLTHAQITPIEDETRRRLFHVIRQLDTYVSAILGFPVLLRDEDVDQPAPTEVDDEYITADAILTPPPGTPSFFQAFNAHNRLMAMLSKVIKYIYPLKGVEDCAKSPSRPDATYMISYARIKEIERELHEWYEQLPTFWRPSNDGPIEVVRVRTLLRFSYAHVQMMLFRPFLHYVSPRLAAGKQIDDRYYNCAAAAISVSRNIVHIGIEIQKQSVLIGPYWFILYTEFFAIISLVFYVLENPDKPGSAEILADAQAGKDVIASLAQRSLAADRVTDALNALFEQLPDRLRKTTAKPAPSRKRSAPAPESTAGTVPLPVHAVLRESNPPKRRSEEIIRPQSSTVRREVPRRPQRTTSFDTVGLQQDGLTGQNFTANLQELLPLDIAMGGTGSDSSSTPSTAHRQLHGFQPPHTPIGSANALYKLDAVMFPGDPIAYPNQPLMDLASQHRGRQSSQGPPAGHIPDSMPFFIPNMYDEIEGQLLGPVPPYLVQQGHTTHLGLDPASQLYNTANMLTLQQSQRSSRHRHIVPSQQQQQHQHLLHQQQQQQQQQQHQQHRQNQHPHPHSHPHQQRQQDVTQRGQRDTLEGLLADPNFEGTGTYWVAQGFDGR